MFVVVNAVVCVQRADTLPAVCREFFVVSLCCVD